jgi:GTP-binding protein
MKKFMVKISKLFTFEGLKRKEVDEAVAGDIVLFAGLDTAYIGETICEKEDQAALPAINIDEPTISLNFLVNDSPFAGKEGDKVQSRVIWARLQKEAEGNVAIKVSQSDDRESFQVAGRGELQLGVLIENMLIISINLEKSTNSKYASSF